MRMTFELNNPFTGEKQYYPDSVYDDKTTGEKMIDFRKQAKCNNKLGQLEDIEEEVGIDLVTLFKALKNGFYYKKESVIVHISKDDLLLSSGAIHFAGKGLIFAGLFLLFKEYGRTWALTKEELK